MKIFLDSYLNNNLGDDLMIDLICHRYPQHEFYIGNRNKLTHCAIKSSNLHIIASILPTEDQILLRILNKVLSFLGIPKLQVISHFRKKPYDGLIELGGSIFKQVTKKSWINKIRDSNYLIVHSNFALVINCNFGPYSSKNFLNKYKKLFQMYDAINFRDIYSYKLFSQLSNVHIFPDIVFASELKSSPKGILGISVINKNNKGIKNYNKEYISDMAELIKIASSKWQIRLYSFCVNEGDTDTCNEIISQSELNNIEIFEHISLEQTKKSLSELSGFVCSRFHANIIAIKLNIPFVPVVYERKTSDMLNDYNINIYRWNICDGERLDIKMAISTLESDPEKNSNYIDRARGHLEILDSYLK